MSASRKRLLLASFIVALESALMVAPLSVAAASITAQMGTVNGSAAFIVMGTGFGSSETIRITGATNDGRQALYPDAKSDRSGTVNTALYAESSVITITATGKGSNVTATATINRPGGSVLPAVPYQPYPPYQPYQPVQPYPYQPYPMQPLMPGQPYAPGAPSVLPVGIGQSVKVDGSGFRASEQVSVWLTAPDATVIPSPGIIADTQGDASTTVTFPGAGHWQVTLSGQSSGITVIDHFAVGGSLAGVPGPSYPGPSYPGGSVMSPVPMYDLSSVGTFCVGCADVLR